MKTLNQMDETEFLRRCWLIADAVSDLLTKTKVMDLRKVMPVFNGSETEEEKKQKREEQSRKTSKQWQKACSLRTLRLPPSCFRCSMSRTWTRTASQRL